MVTFICTGCQTPVSSSNTSSQASSHQNNSPLNIKNTESLQQELVQLIQAEMGELQELQGLTDITKAHTMQIAQNPQNTGFKTLAYTPLAPSPLNQLILSKGIFASDNLSNAFLTASTPEAVIEKFKAQLNDAQGVLPFSHYGLSVILAENTYVVSLILLTEIVELDNMTTTLEPTSNFELKGKIIDPSFQEPSVLMTLPSGEVKNFSITQVGDQFSASLPFSEPGYYSLEINVNGALGTQPATNFVVAVGTEPLPPQERSQTPAPLITDLKSAQNTLLDLLNKDRQSQGLGPLALDSQLSQAAQNHSDDMVTNKFVGHNSPTQGTPTQQAQAVGISEPTAQNIALSRQLSNAQEELMSSPGHRQTILDTKHTHVGFGITRSEDGFLYVTQDFVQRKAQINPLPAKISANSTLNVSGQVLDAQMAYVGVFLDQKIIGDPIELGGDRRFSVQVPVGPIGQKRIKIGLSTAPVNNTFSFEFFNVWNLEVN